MSTAPKVILVTGSGSGIGKAIVERLAGEGNTVLLTDLPHVIDSLDTAHLQSGVKVHPLDVGDEHSRTEVINTIAREHGKLDVLVNCAGVGRDARLTNIKDEDLAFTLGINLFGAFSLIRQALPLMQESTGGAIVNIASRAWLGIFGSGAYSASKGGLIGATRSLALEVGHLGITVNCIAPGYIATPLSATLPQEVLDKTLRSIPVQRGGVPEDIAAAVRYLALDGSYVTGQVLTVCGGRSIGDPTSR
ncbi:3-oxoacyl-ACP reductase [Rhodococcus ruber BKS 20-38]|uniref:3-oxoacyl-ACP reductase n=1 Tax=Rhodococcus ruber BKS 20-38 TaxID=1278076 RepID=M2Y3S0_9NOCA|nr:SDR family oxidoreductase [Rhodococcus ruber]EME56240.1 3-oxoacyl-ACP reductase [Rhodococcus ruber BKS 20-38]